MPYKGNCPLVPMDLLQGRPSRWLGGQILTATSYVTSWSLSPAIAYRNNDRFHQALKAMPVKADIFIERLMPPYVSVHSPIVATRSSPVTGSNIRECCTSIRTPTSTRPASSSTIHSPRSIC